ncbi:unnamed protein product, partial [Candidula unifasciata]
YDDLGISGNDVQHVYDILKKRKEETRIYYGEAVYGVGKSLSYEVWVVAGDGREVAADTGYLLGSAKEMPWTNEILSKFDITEAVRVANVSTDKPVK